MNKKEFLKLVKKDKYQIFLFSSPVPRPYSFAIHVWFVINKKGKIDRWEFGKFRSKAEKSWGLVHLNVRKDPTEGMNKSFKKNYPRFSGNLIKCIEGDSSSQAKKIVDFLERKAKYYPLRDEYRMTGPNSNTWVRWVLDHFPDSGLKIPWNAFGKNWKGLKKRKT